MISWVISHACSYCTKSSQMATLLNRSLEQPLCPYGLLWQPCFTYFYVLTLEDIKLVYTSSLLSVIFLSLQERTITYILGLCDSFFFFFNPGLNRISQSVQLLSCVWTLRPHGLQHTRPPCPSPTPGVYLNSCPLGWWCHPAISLSAVPPSQSFQMSQFFTSGGQSIGVSASTSVIPMNIQDLFSLGWTGWISQQSKGLSRVFSNTTVQKNQFFGA